MMFQVLFLVTWQQFTTEDFILKYYKRGSRDWCEGVLKLTADETNTLVDVLDAMSGLYHIQADFFVIGDGAEINARDAYFSLRNNVQYKNFISDRLSDARGVQKSFFDIVEKYSPIPGEPFTKCKKSLMYAIKRTVAQSAGHENALANQDWDTSTSYNVMANRV